MKLISALITCTLLATTLTTHSAHAHTDKKAATRPHAHAKADHKAKSRASAASASKAHTKRGADEDEFTNFNQWRAVGEFIDEMTIDYGFERDALRALFGKAHYLDSVVKLINPAPAGKSKNWSVYRSRFIDSRRLNAGVAFWNRYAQELDRAQQEFGVPPDIIIGILGVETLYGRSTGKFRVVDALTTLAFAYPEAPNRVPRMQYFRNELKQALLFARESNIDPLSLSGSFAGAIGWPQFMPGSIRNFAVDFDGDGKIDLRNSPVDAIGSVASFLSQHGWQRGDPVIFHAKVTPDTSWPSLIGQGLVAKFSPEQLQQAGVILPEELPTSLNYGLVDLEDGERPTLYLLGTTNFFAITHYNRSYYYAMAVIELGKAVHQQRTR
jgi:membrane-bound lytic murein transglycosylase B